MRKSMLLFLIVVALAGPAWAQMPIRESVPAERHVAVEVDNMVGTIEVTGWDRQEVLVTGTLGEGAERVEVNGSRRRVKVRVVLPKRVREVGGTRLEIQVPSRASLEVETVSAPVLVSDVGGALEVETTSGNVNLRGVGKDVEVETVSGQVSVAGRRVDRARLSSTSGMVRFDAELGPRGALEIETVSGNVLAFLQAGLSADFRLGTVSGAVLNDFGPATGGQQGPGPGASLRFTTGSGGASVEVETVSGSVKLVRK